MTAGVVPTGQVNIDETRDSSDFGFAMPESSGMPVGVQIIGWQQEQVIRVMREL